MFLNIIFFATLYPVLFIICIVFSLQNSYKDGMLFAVNMKREWVEDENVKAIQKRFKKEMIWYSLILAIIPFSCLFYSILFHTDDNLDGVVDCSDYSIDASNCICQ